MWLLEDNCNNVGERVRVSTSLLDLKFLKMRSLRNKRKSLKKTVSEIDFLSNQIKYFSVVPTLDTVYRDFPKNGASSICSRYFLKAGFKGSNYNVSAPSFSRSVNGCQEAM